MTDALKNHHHCVDKSIGCRFPASANPAVFGIQKTLVEAWTIVNEAYVDAGFGGHNWEKELGDALMMAYAATEPSKAYDAVETMLNKLGDPFTRIVTAPYAPAHSFSDFLASCHALEQPRLLGQSVPDHHIAPVCR